MDFKVVFVPKLGGGAQFEKEYKTAPEAETALGALAHYTLLLHEAGLMPDYANVGMVMKLDEDGEWVEVDGDGNEL